jgi:ubiquitin carboxyl-terminal hydrolase 7
MSQKVGERLKIDPHKLRFTNTQADGSPNQVLKRSQNPAIADIIQPGDTSNQTGTGQTSILLYEILDAPIRESEMKENLKVVWTGQHNKREGVHSFVLPRTTNVADLTAKLAEQVEVSSGEVSSIRIFSITRDGKKQQEYISSELIGNVPDRGELFAEVFIL